MDEGNRQSSGDEAPEDISHSQSKGEAQERLKLENEARQKQKDAKKEVRRKRNTRLVEQKQAKKGRLVLNERLPDEIIDILSSVDKEKDEAKKEDKSKIQGVVSKSGGSALVTKTRKKERKTQDCAPAENLGISDEEECETDESEEEQEKGNVIKAYVLNQSYKSKETKAEKGRQFLKEQLYGSRIQRVAASSARNVCAIKSARPKAAF